MTRTSLRPFEPRRQIPNASGAVEDVLTLARQLAETDPHAGLTLSERKLLQVYAALAEKQGQRLGLAGASWAEDGEIARSIGTSVSTVRRNRRRLAKANGRPALIEIRYVPPFHLLPDGAKTMHGANIVTLVNGVSNGVRKTPGAEVVDTLRATAARMEADAAKLRGLAELIEQAPQRGSLWNRSHNAVRLHTLTTPARPHLAAA